MVDLEDGDDTAADAKDNGDAGHIVETPGLYGHVDATAIVEMDKLRRLLWRLLEKLETLKNRGTSAHNVDTGNAAAATAADTVDTAENVEEMETLEQWNSYNGGTDAKREILGSLMLGAMEPGDKRRTGILWQVEKLR